MLEPLEKDGVVLLTAPGLLRSGVSVVFSSRRGAEGTPPFDGLNLSYSVGDEPAYVRSCRAKLASSAGIEISDTVFCRQVHGTVTRVAGPLERGRGARDYESALSRCDAMITNTRGLSIGVLTADCVPLAIVARDGSAVAAVHAGWRGLVSGVMAWSTLNGSIISGTPNITATSIVTITANSSFGCDRQLRPQTLGAVGDSACGYGGVRRTAHRVMLLRGGGGRRRGLPITFLV